MRTKQLFEKIIYGDLYWDLFFCTSFLTSMGKINKFPALDCFLYFISYLLNEIDTFSGQDLGEYCRSDLNSQKEYV